MTTSASDAASTTPDWRLVAGKEIADLLGRMGRRPLTRTLGVVAIFGLLLPLRFRDAANLPAFFAVFMAFLPARLVAIDSLAGERERGTLESLLATPLSDAGIAGGKIAAATAYGAVRGWLFVAVWLAAATVLRVTGLISVAVPSAAVLAVVLVASVAVAYAAAVFGVWQSARAPSVRAIVESGGLLRLTVLVVVFFVAPWVLGLLSPDGTAPTLALPGARGSVSAGALTTALAARPGVTGMLGGVVAVGAAAVLWACTVSAVRRCRREALALVDGTDASVRGFRFARRRQ